MRTGQISFDYILGSLVFFAAVILLAGNVIETLPQLQSARVIDDLELTGWAITTSVIHSDGYWDNGTHSGTDWHVGSHSDHVQRIGLESYGAISPVKVNALVGLNQTQVADAIGTDKNVNIEVSRTTPVDTSGAFVQGNPPTYLIEPTYPAGTEPDMHYGSVTVNGDTAHFLLANVTGWYNYLWVSDSWDFSDTNTDTYNLSTTRFLTINAISYEVPAVTTDISEGRLLALERRLGRVGPRPRVDSENIIRIQRFGAVEDDILTVVFRLWN